MNRQCKHCNEPREVVNTSFKKAIKLAIHTMDCGHQTTEKIVEGGIYEIPTSQQGTFGKTHQMEKLKKKPWIRRLFNRVGHYMVTL